MAESRDSFIANIQAQVDTSKLNSQVGDIKLKNKLKLDFNKTHLNTELSKFTPTAKLKLNIDANYLQNQIQSVFNTMQVQIKTTSSTGGTTGSTGGGSGSSGSDMDKSAQSAKQLQAAINAISTQNLELSIARVNAQMENLKTNMVLNKDATDLGFNLGDLEAQMKEVQDLDAELKQLYADYQQGNTTDTQNKQLVQEYSEVKTSVTTLRNELSLLSTQYSKVASSEEKNAKAASIEKYYNNNTKAVQKYGDQLQSLAQRYKEANTQDEVKQIDAEAKELKATIEAEGLTGNTVTSGWKKATDAVGKFISSAMLIRQCINVAKQMVSAVEDIDYALTQLEIVTGASGSEMTEFLENATALAKDLGQSISDVLDSIQVFSRLGYNLEEATELAEYSGIMSNVAGVDIEEATTGLTSVIKGFGMEVDEVEHVTDVLIDIGQSYAVSAGEILEAMEKSSAALSATGTSFEESVAIIAAGDNVAREI